MKTTLLHSLLFLSAISVSNAQETQNRNVGPFNKIETSGSVNVMYTSSDSISLTVKAEVNELDNVLTKVENGTLIVSNKGHFTKPVNVSVKNNHLFRIQSSGASTFKTTNSLKEDSIVLGVSGAANIDITVQTLKLKSIQSGASQLSLAGTTDKFLAELSGASTLKAYNLVSKNTDITATGASSSKIFVSEKLKANASGASTIKVRGEATDINAEAESASSILRVVDSKKNNKDSTEFHFGRRKIIVIGKGEEELSLYNGHQVRRRKRDFKHWSGFSLGVNGYMNSGGSINLSNNSKYMDLNYSRSFNFQLNVFERQFNIINNNFKIITGFGIDYHSYALTNKTNLNPDSSFTSGKIDSMASSVYRKNRLRCTYLQVPLLLEFNTSNDPRKTFHLAFGVIGQYLIASRTRQIIEQDKFDITRVRKDGYNLSPFAAKAHVNFGYKGWTIFAEYSLTPLFQPGKGPDLYPFSVGLRIIPFV